MARPSCFEARSPFSTDSDRERCGESSLCCLVEQPEFPTCRHQLAGSELSDRARTPAGQIVVGGTFASSPRRELGLRSEFCCRARHLVFRPPRATRRRRFALLHPIAVTSRVTELRSQSHRDVKTAGELRPLREHSVHGPGRPDLNGWTFMFPWALRPQAAGR